MKQPSLSVVRGTLTASVASTAVHYTDNYINIDEYPQPDYINHEMIVVVWILLTLLGVAGYLFFRDEKRVPAGIYLLLYSYTGLSSLGHFAFGSMGEFSTRMHLTIWLDGLTGAAVAICAVWVLIASPSRELQH